MGDSLQATHEAASLVDDFTSIAWFLANRQSKLLPRYRCDSLCLLPIVNSTERPHCIRSDASNALRETLGRHTACPVSFSRCASHGCDVIASQSATNRQYARSPDGSTMHLRDSKDGAAISCFQAPRQYGNRVTKVL
jgi:hypothetical protein